MDTIPALLSTVQSLYSQGHSAYWLPPIVARRKEAPIGRIQSGDSVIFCCRRGEREIQLTEALTDPGFTGFRRERLNPLTFVPLVQYHPKFLHLPTAFPPLPVDQTLGEAVSQAGLSQLRLAETEKFAHVTYFLNGKRADAFPNEHHASVASDLVDPLRSLRSLITLLPRELAEHRPALTVMNLATGDLLGHSDNLDTKKDCASAVDRAIGSILHLTSTHGMWTAITADHGLLEDHGPSGGPINMSHTTHPVPFVLVSPDGTVAPLEASGTLADVAPTLLSILGIETPSLMSGCGLLRSRAPQAGRVFLLVLDGWGLGDPSRIDPIKLAHTPNWDRLIQYPVTSLEASGEAVGLLPGTKGNSESGHLTIGAGRPVLQDDARIESALRDGSFGREPAFHVAIQDAQSRGGTLHLIGLLSKTSSHGSVDYVLELARLASQFGVKSLYVHLITDGRSSRSERLPMDLEQAGRSLAEMGTGSIVSLVGRGFALDRGGAYEKKTRPVYEALVEGKGAAAEVLD